MSSTKKVVIIFSGILLASIIGIAVTFGIGGWDIFQRYRVEIDEKSDLDLAGISGLRIEAASSDIHIVPSDTARVELNGTVISAKQKENYLSVSEENGTLIISVRKDEWSILNLFNIWDLDLTVYLPADSMLDASVRCSSGNIDMTGMKFGSVEVWLASGNTTVRDCSAVSFFSDASSGNTEIESSAMESMKLTCRSGNIILSGTSGSVYARSTSGSISIAGAKGALDVGCTSGNIDITDASGTVEAEGSSGNISIDVAAGTVPPITVGLNSGSVNIYMPMDAAFDLEAGTTSGRITTDLGISVSGSLNNSHSGDEVSGACNGGGSLVSIRVTSGNINIIGK